jgi:hypothetical protein
VSVTDLLKAVEGSARVRLLELLGVVVLVLHIHVIFVRGGVIVLYDLREGSIVNDECWKQRLW